MVSEVFKLDHITLSDLFLMHQFHLYGFKVVHYYSLPAEEIDIWNIKNPMCEAFPRVANCTYYQYGSGGRQTVAG